jgi:hypothetical protein
MIIAAFLLAAAPPYGALEPFSDEESAAHAYEAQIYCLAEGTMQHKDDVRDAHVLATEIVEACAEKQSALRSALVDVYSRKPALIGDSKNAAEAADFYVNGAMAQVEEAIRKFRTKKN